MPVRKYRRKKVYRKKRKTYRSKITTAKISFDTTDIIPATPGILDPATNNVSQIIHQLSDIGTPLGAYQRLWDEVRLDSVKITFTYDANWAVNAGTAIQPSNNAITHWYRVDRSGTSITSVPSVNDMKNSAKVRSFRPTIEKNRMSMVYKPSALTPVYTGIGSAWAYRPINPGWLSFETAMSVDWYSLHFGFESAVDTPNNPLYYNVNVEYRLSFRNRIQR